MSALYSVTIAPHVGVTTTQNTILEEAVTQAVRLLRLDYPKMATVALETGLLLAEAEQ